MTESVKYSGSLEGDNNEKSSVDPGKDMSTDLEENHEKIQNKLLLWRARVFLFHGGSLLLSPQW